MLKVAIVGCGKIADAHAAQIQRIGGCGLHGRRFHGRILYQV